MQCIYNYIYYDFSLHFSMDYLSNKFSSDCGNKSFLLGTEKDSKEDFLSVLFLTFLTKDFRERGDQNFLLKLITNFSILESYPKNESV